MMAIDDRRILNCKRWIFKSHFGHLPRLDKSSWFDDHLLPHPLLPIACLLPITTNNDRNFSLDGICIYVLLNRENLVEYDYLIIT